MTEFPPPPPPPLPQPANDDRSLLLVAHLGGIINIICCAVLGFVPSLVIYLANSTKPNVRREAAKAFNFQMFNLAIGLVSVVFYFGRIFAFNDGGLIFLTSCIIQLVGLGFQIANVTFCIMNAIKASDGRETSYPYSIPFLRVN
jgi:uncharacterized Tic20 family protein